MASSPPPPPPPSFCYLTMPSLKRNRLSPEVRAQSFRDHEGRSSNSVDANLRVLRKRIEEVRIKERLERCCRIEHGWNYASGYDNYKNKRSAELLHVYKIFGLVSGTFGLTIVSGTLCLCLASLLVHMS